MRKIKTALVGCGKVGHLHAAALRDLPESEFVAVCARTPEKAQAFAEKYRVAPFTDVREMIAKSGAEAILHLHTASATCRTHHRRRASGRACARGKTARVIAGGLRCHARRGARKQHHYWHRVPAPILSAVPSAFAARLMTAKSASPFSARPRCSAGATRRITRAIPGAAVGRMKAAACS